jgi:uncharacterized protein YuzE
MKIRYDKETDALYIDLLDLPSMESEEIAPESLWTTQRTVAL